LSFQLVLFYVTSERKGYDALNPELEGPYGTLENSSVVKVDKKNILKEYIGILENLFVKKIKLHNKKINLEKIFLF